MYRLTPLLMSLSLFCALGCQATRFVGVDTLAGYDRATPLAPAMPDDLYQAAVALNPAGDRVAYASKQGLFVAALGQTPRRLADSPDEVRGFAWSPDGRYLLLCEREIAPRCDGNTCSSSTSDEVYRLRRVSPDDGSVATIAEHVPGLYNLSPAPSGEALAVIREGHLSLIHPADGRLEAAAPEHRCETFSWSPDGRAIAVLSSSGTPNDTSRPVFRVDAATLEATPLGNLPASLGQSFQSPFWRPDSQAVRFLDVVDNRDHLLAEEVPAAGGEFRTFEFARGALAVKELSPSPNGTRLVGLSYKDIHTPDRLIAFDWDTGATKDLAPAAQVLQWLPDGHRALAAVGNSWPKRYYLLTVD